MTGSDNQLSRTTHIPHACIADGSAVDELAMTAVCGNTTPCRQCGNCVKASKHIHPDIITISKLKDKREITVDQIRQLRRDAYILPNEAQRKVYIIQNADIMNINAQNALLRVLEEPPSFVTIILQTSNPSSLLPTVRSRCIELRSGLKSSAAHPLLPQQPDSLSIENSEPAELADTFISALGSNVLLTKCMFSIEKLDKPAMDAFITAARERLSAVIRDKTQRTVCAQEAVLAGDLLTKAAEMLELNVSAGHISAMLCAALIKP